MGLFDWLQKIVEERIPQEEKAIYEALKQILIFPGNRQEFEKLVGYECFLIDNKRKDKGLVFINNLDDLPFNQYPFELRKQLVNEGIVGLINATPISFYMRGDDQARYGLPVGKK